MNFEKVHAAGLKFVDFIASGVLVKCGSPAFDAVRVRLIEIGEARKVIDPELLAHEPAWIDVAGMRNHLAHRYFDTSHAIVQATVSENLHPW
ncbi:MAG: HepT-like ribonuclease domain-containing protein [Pseudonocardiaceae bacterium]